MSTTDFRAAAHAFLNRDRQPPPRPASVPVPLAAFTAGWRDAYDFPPDPTGFRTPWDE